MTPDAVHLDFETRSVVDLKKFGFDRYCANESTVPTCMAFSFNDEPDVPLVESHAGGKASRRLVTSHPALPRLLDHVVSGGLVYAHNAQFEFGIWNRRCVPLYGWPELKIEQVRCTMAMAFAMSLPGALGEVAVALGVQERKDYDGHRAMMRTCKPRTYGKPSKTDPGCPVCQGTAIVDNDACQVCVTWWDDAATYDTLYRYCQQDVRTERDIHRRMVDLSPQEWRVWQLDQKINRYGVRIDVPAVSNAVSVVLSEKKRMDADMKRITGGHVDTCQSSAKLTEWLCAQGAVTAGVAKADVKALLDEEDLPGDLWDDELLIETREDGPVRAALKVRQVAAKASTAKLQKMLDTIGPDEIARFLYQYHAAHTGRWGGRRIQPQNMMRPFKFFEDVEKQEAVLAALVSGWSAQSMSLFFGEPMDAIASVMRGFLVPHVGNEFLVGDFANIEGRGLAWLAGDERKLEAFRMQDAGTGPEIYIVAGAAIYKVDPSTLTKKSPERQIGKVAELALGFQGGIGAFKAMARVYGITNIPDRQADEIVQAWRDAHPLVAGVQTEYGRKGGYWADVEKAAMDAVRYPGKKFAAGAAGREVTYLVNGSFLWAQLPSGRCLCYPYPDIRSVMTSWGKPKEALTYKTALSGDPKSRKKMVEDLSNTNKFARISTYGGSLTENCFAAGTLVLTIRGWAAIETVTSADLVFDGREFVATGGAINQGIKETVQWQGVEVTPDHRILVGKTWLSLIAGAATASQEARDTALDLADSLLHSRVSETTPPLWPFATAGSSESSRLARFTEATFRVALSVLMPPRAALGEGTRTSFPTTNFAAFGSTDTPPLFPAVAIPNLPLSRITARAGLESRLTGETTFASFFAMQKRLTTGTNEDWTSTESTITDRMPPEMSASSVGGRTRTIGGELGACSSRGATFRSPTSCAITSLDGDRKTPSRTIWRKEELPSGLSSTTTLQPVFDLLNCGPRARFVVLTEVGPVIAHNCDQAICADIQRDAMLRLADAGLPIAMHTHDEIVGEVAKGRGKELLPKFEHLMEVVPPWAAGLPITVDAFTAHRYRK